MTVTAPRPLLVVAAALLAPGLIAGNALGHASLVASSPADGAIVSVAHARDVILTFDDDLDPSKSRFTLVADGGATAATGTVGNDRRTMAATGLSLEPVPYQVRWVAVASDGDLTRGTVSFTVVEGDTPEGTVTDPAIAAAASPAIGATGDAAPASADALLPIVAAFAIVAGVGFLVLRRGRAA